MSVPQIYQTTWQEDGTVYVLARLKKKDSSHNLVIVQQSDFTSITYAVYTLDGTAVVSPTSLTVASVVLNALSTGTIWTLDSTGFNFITSLPTTNWPTGDTDYRLEIKFTLTSGEVFFLLIEGPTVGVHQS